MDTQGQTRQFIRESERPHPDKTKQAPHSPLLSPAVASPPTFPSRSLRRRRSVLPATPMASKWVRPEVSSAPRSDHPSLFSARLVAYPSLPAHAGVPAVRGDGRGHRHLRVQPLPQHHRQPRSEVRIRIPHPLASACLILATVEWSRSARFRPVRGRVVLTLLLGLLSWSCLFR